VVWDVDYTPFGEIANYVTNTLPVDQPFRFPGQYQDTLTGLYYNWNRYYMSTLSRYSRPDPFAIKFKRIYFGEHEVTYYFYSPMGVSLPNWLNANSYQYVVNNPLSYFDILALWEACISLHQWPAGLGGTGCFGKDCYGRKFFKLSGGLGAGYGASGGAGGGLPPPPLGSNAGARQGYLGVGGQVGGAIGPLGGSYGEVLGGLSIGDLPSGDLTWDAIDMYGETGFGLGTGWGIGASGDLGIMVGIAWQ
jgi:RHS repeat-associated protein